MEDEQLFKKLLRIPTNFKSVQLFVGFIFIFTYSLISLGIKLEVFGVCFLFWVGFFVLFVCLFFPIKHLLLSNRSI